MDNLPNEVLLEILVRVPYLGDQCQVLRDVCPHWDGLLDQDTSRRKIAQVQFPTFYDLNEILQPAPAYGWGHLNALQAKVDRNYAWLAILPQTSVDPEILDTAVALADAIAGYKRVLQPSPPTDPIDSAFCTSLNLAKLVSSVLSPESLIILRYLNVLADEALQVKHNKDPFGHFSAQGYSDVEVHALCLLRSLLSESGMLSMLAEPRQLYLRADRVQSMFNDHYERAEELLAHLEDTDLDIYGCRDAMMLHLATDQILKYNICAYEERLMLADSPIASLEDKTVEKPVDNLLNYLLEDLGLEDDVGGLADAPINPENPIFAQPPTGASSATQDNDQQTITKLARACRTSRYINIKIRGLVDDKQRGKELHNRIEVKQMAARMKAEFNKIARMTTDEMRVMANEQLEEFGLTEWPESPYLAF